MNCLIELHFIIYNEIYPRKSLLKLNKKQRFIKDKGGDLETKC